MCRRRTFGEKCDKNTILLCHFDGNVTDSSINKYSIVKTGLSFTTGKFGQAIQCGNGYLTLPQNIFRNVFIKNFTIDYWCYVNNTIPEKFDFILQSNTHESGYCAIRFEVYKHIIRFFATSSGYPWNIIKTFDVSLSGWNHIALVREDDAIRIYVNGYAIGYSIYNYQDFPSTYSNNWIGSGYNGINKTGNYIDEFRISNIARWTSNFTPPTKPY